MISIRAVSLVREIHNLQISGNTSLLVIEDFSNKTVDVAVLKIFEDNPDFKLKAFISLCCFRKPFFIQRVYFVIWWMVSLGSP